MNRIIAIIAAFVLLALGVVAQANIAIDTVVIGNPGNVADTLTGFGKVDYTYSIGKYEITAGQYAAFLNAKAAASDIYGLYNTKMGDIAGYNVMGCNILRSGVGTEADPYNYTVPSDWANRPVNYVCWYDAVRFANWLTNGQGNGDTESGSYLITGGGYNDGTVTVPTAAQRKALTSAKWFLTSEDEWYKAAYYNCTAGNYYLYPTSSNSPPGRDLADTMGNNANYYAYSYLIGSPYYRTEVGAFQNSASPYGTFDQGGNIYEWNESLIGTSRGLRGSWFGNEVSLFRSSDRHTSYPTFEAFGSVGFRVAKILPGLRGTITLQELITQQIAGTKVTLEITQAATTVSKEVTLAADGGFVLITDMTGPANVRAKASHWLAQQKSVANMADEVVSFSLINGDCDGDNEVTSTDLSILGLALGSTPGDSNWDSTADLDGDGEITSTDLSILGLSLGLSGD